MGEVVRVGGALQVVGEVLVVGGSRSRVWGEGGGHQRGKRHWERLLEGRRRSFEENIKKKKLILNREKISSMQEFHVVVFYIIIITTSKNEHRVVNVDDDKVKR